MGTMFKKSHSSGGWGDLQSLALLVKVEAERHETPSPPQLMGHQPGVYGTIANKKIPDSSKIES